MVIGLFLNNVCMVFGLIVLIFFISVWYMLVIKVIVLSDMSGMIFVVFIVIFFRYNKNSLCFEGFFMLLIFFNCVYMCCIIVMDE